MLKTTNTLQNKKIFIQIGAGAGDQDIRSGCRDGFTEYIKSLNSFEIDRILLVEPNPLNLENLRNCWSNYPQAEIYEIGIVPPHHGDKITFYYAEEDAPNYQVFSMNRQHVEKHYPFGSILSIDVPTEKLESFLSKNVGNHLIELIAMDVESRHSNKTQNLCALQRDKFWCVAKCVSKCLLRCYTTTNITMTQYIT